MSYKGRPAPSIGHGYPSMARGSQQMIGSDPPLDLRNLGNGKNGREYNLSSLFRTIPDRPPPISKSANLLTTMQQFGIMESTGLGAGQTNAVQTTQFVLEPHSYESEYSESKSMNAMLPADSFVMLFCPVEGKRANATLHTVSTVNKWLRSDVIAKDRSLINGDSFADEWTFAGVPVAVEAQNEGSSHMRMIATVCTRGPKTVRNIFPTTNGVGQSGTRLYLLLCRFDQDVKTLELAWHRRSALNNRSQSSAVDLFVKNGTPILPRATNSVCWQIVPHMTMSDKPPRWDLWHGMDWTGAYWEVGTISQDDSWKAHPGKGRQRVEDAIHPAANSGYGWQESMKKLNWLEIYVGGKA
jgi:hypothetical protein